MDFARSSIPMPRTFLTPKETQFTILRQSVLISSETLLRSLSNFEWLLVQQLGRYFLFLGDIYQANYLLRLNISQEIGSKTGIFEIHCTSCDYWIYRPRFVCRKCARVDLCSSCVHKSCNNNLHTDQHKIFKVSDVIDEESCFGLVSKNLGRFLSNVMHGYSAPYTNETEIGLSNDSVFSPLLEKYALLSLKAILGPVSTACAVLFGLFGVILGLC